MLAARRGLALLAFALVGTLPAFAQTAPSTLSPLTPNYDFYALEATAGGFRTFMSIKGYLPVDPLVDAALPDAHAIVDTGRKVASASLPYPGETVLSVPGTAAGLGGVPNVPPYPLAAMAQDPNTPAADLSAGATRLHAEASPIHAAALAAAEDQSGPAGAGGPTFTLGTVRAQVTSRLLDADTLESKATSALRDVALLGGQLRIGSIVSTVTSRITSGKPTVSTPSVQLSGVTFNGQPVAIDEQGIHVGASAAALPGLDSALRETLAQQGVSIFTTKPDRTVTANEGSARGGALVLRVSGTFQNNPVLITYTLGDARVAVKASGQKAALLTTPVFGAGGAIDSATEAANQVAGPVGGATAPAVTPSSPRPLDSGARPRAVARGRARQNATTNTRLVSSDDRLDLVGLYRTLALLAVVALAGAAALTRALRRRTTLDRDLKGIRRW